MKRYLLILFAMALSLAFVADGAVAQRGGRGGGAGGGRAGGGASPSINRSPSMSRPAASRPTTPSKPSVSRPSAPTRPSTPSAGTRPAVGTTPRPSTPNAGTRPSTGQRPSSGQVGDFLNLPKPSSGTRPSAGGPPTPSQLPSTSRDKIQNGIGAGSGQRPAMPDWFKPGTTPPTPSQLPARPGTGQGPGTPPGTGQPPAAKPPIPSQLPATKPPTGSQPPAAKPPIPSQLPGVKPPVGNQPPVTRPPGSRPPVATPPIVGRPGVPPVRPPGVRPPTRPPVVVRPPGRPPRPWYPGHPHHPTYRPDHWWRWATATAVTGWVIHRWTTPIYYRYGSGGTVYYENNIVYVNGQEYGPAEQYYNEATELATAVPEMTDEQAAELEWMSLGVFAITAEGVNASSMYLQLALSKNGIIGGTFYNETTGATHPVEGVVDEETQRAAWKAIDGTNADIVMETGVFNLTQDQAPVLVHFGPEKTETVLLVRLDESEQPEAEEAAPSAQGGVNLNLPGVNVQVGAGGVQVQAPGVNVDTGAGGTSVSAPAGVQVDTGSGGTQVTAPGVDVQR